MLIATYWNPGINKLNPVLKSEKINESGHKLLNSKRLSRTYVCSKGPSINYVGSMGGRGRKNEKSCLHSLWMVPNEAFKLALNLGI